MFYKKKGSPGSSTQIKIDSESTRSKVVTGLDEYIEYEFQVLAFTSVGDGPNSTVMSVQTKEDGKLKQKILRYNFYTEARYYSICFVRTSCF